MSHRESSFRHLNDGRHLNDLFLLLFIKCVQSGHSHHRVKNICMCKFVDAAVTGLLNQPQDSLPPPGMVTLEYCLSFRSLYQSHIVVGENTSSFYSIG